MFLTFRILFFTLILMLKFAVFCDIYMIQLLEKSLIFFLLDELEIDKKRTTFLTLLLKSR